MGKIINFQDFKKLKEIKLSKEDRVIAKDSLLYDDDKLNFEEFLENKYMQAYNNLSDEEKDMLNDDK